MKILSFVSLLLVGCVVNEDKEADYPSPCSTAIMDSANLEHICRQVELTK